MQKYKTEYKDYSKYVAIMISTDRQIFIDKSAARVRMTEYTKLYKELHIIVLSNKKFEKIDVSSQFTISSTNSSLRWNYVKDAREVGKKIVKNINKEIPILITCQDPFETALVGKCLASLRTDSELLLQIHTDLFSPYFIDKRIGFINSFLNRIRLFISRSTLNQAQVIRVVSEKIADSLVEKSIDSEKIIVKPIEVNVDYIKNSEPSFDLRKKFSQFKKIVVMVSRIESEKNIDMALRAMKIVKQSIPDSGLVIVGSGSLVPRLKKQTYSLGINSSVVFTGWQGDLVPYYKAADVFLVTSWFEGYGMVFKEAQAASCKIVSTDVGIARDVGARIVDWKVEDIARGIVEAI